VRDVDRVKSRVESKHTVSHPGQAVVGRHLMTTAAPSSSVAGEVGMRELVSARASRRRADRSRVAAFTDQALALRETASAGLAS
jgi:hypothetical protein